MASLHHRDSKNFQFFISTGLLEHENWTTQNFWILIHVNLFTYLCI